MTRDEAAEELANVIAKCRTGSSVYMDGSHNPRPSERLAAERFIETLEYHGLLR
jgi:hypothetical protein